MAEGSIATAYVTVKPDLSEFRDELRAGLDTTDVPTKTVRVDADTGEARLELSELEARIDEMQSHAATLKVGVDDTGTRRTITDLQSALDQYRNETLTPNLDPARMEQINRELDGLDGRLREVSTDLDTTASHADKAAASLGSGSGGAAGTGLMSVALAASPALLAVGAAGGGALAAISVASGAAVIGLGAFALAAKGSLTEAKTQASGLLTQWQETQAAFTDPVIQKAVSLIPAALNLASPLVATTSQALLGLELSAQGALGSPYWRQFSTYIAGEGGAAIRSAGDLFGGLAHLLSGFAEGFAPELSRIDSDTQRWAQDLTKWGNEARNGGMSSFIDYVQQNGPVLAHTLEQLASDAVILVKDTSPLGPVWLNIANVAARLLGDLEKLNPTLTTWAVGLGTAAFAVNRLAVPLGGLSGLITGAKGAWGLAGDAFAVGSTGVYAAATASSGLASTLGSVLPTVLALTPGLDVLAAAGLNAAGVFSHFSDGFESGTKAWAQDFVQSLPAGTDAVKAVNDQIDSLNGRVTTLTGLADQLAAHTGLWGQTVGSLSGQYAALGASLEANGYQPTLKLSDVYKDLADNALPQSTDQVKALQAILPGLQTATSAQTTAQQQANTALGLAAGYTGDAALQFGTLTGQLQSANQALTRTESLLNSLLTTELGVAQSTDQFYSAVQSLTTSLHSNGTTMDETTQKGLANKQAFDGVASSVSGVIQAMEKQGATSDQIVGKVQSLTGYIETQAAKYGLTSAQVDTYLQQLGLTPAQVRTDLQLSGYDAASQKVSSINQQIAQIPRSVTVDVSVTQIGNIGAVGPQGGMHRFATGTSHAPGGLSVVGDGGGPETLITPDGRVATVGRSGPEVVYIPEGSRILTASQTAGLPHYADGVGNTPSLASIVIEDHRTVQVGDIASKADIMAALDADRTALVAEIRQLVPA